MALGWSEENRPARRFWVECSISAGTADRAVLRAGLAVDEVMYTVTNTAEAHDVMAALTASVGWGARCGAGPGGGV